MNEYVIIGLIGLGGAIIGGIITYLTQKQVAQTTSLPGFILSMDKRLDSQEKEIDAMKKSIKRLESDIDQWKGNYFKLLSWLKSFFKKNDIDVEIPEFHINKS